MPPKFSVSPENDFLFSREHYMSENSKNELVQRVSKPSGTQQQCSASKFAKRLRQKGIRKTFLLER